MKALETIRPMFGDTYDEGLVKEYFGARFLQELNSSAPESEIAAKVQLFLVSYPSALLAGVDLRHKNLSSYTEIVKAFCEQLNVLEDELPFVSNSTSKQTYCVCVLGLQRLSLKEKLRYWWFRRMLEDNIHVVLDDFSWR